MSANSNSPPPGLPYIDTLPHASNLTKSKIVVITGAGISAESGLKTFRDSDGLWNDYLVEDVAIPGAWDRNPELVLNFYNECRQQMSEAEPNAAHKAIAKLEDVYEVVVITQNIDDLHERSGSSNVIHLHGEISKAQSTLDDTLLYNIGNKPLLKGDHCELRSQLRPHIVWFGENILNYDEARNHAEKIIVSLEVDSVPFGYKFIRGKATNLVPCLVENWLQEKIARVRL